jgi:Ca-activated chloride channel family protein
MIMIKLLFSFVLLLVSAFVLAAQIPDNIREGSLFASTKSGEKVEACPLKSTSVRADISGSIARVRVGQEFVNNFNEPIEAVYRFPLSQNSAVDDMTMKIGDRTIRGVVMKKAEARKVYETAKQEGKAASLLDQDRPNIFTQAVANIMPGDRIVIEISYVENLKFDNGSYEFVFPMTITPRYQPSSGGDQGSAKVAEPIAETRAGHDISIEVNLDAAVPVEEIRSSSHKINSITISSNTAKISLASETTIPNKDFVLRYDVIGKRMEDAVMATRGAKGGFFSLILSPPDRMSSEDLTPKEIVFVLDTSGSMSGFPIEKAKESMKMALDGLYPDDTFNLITFAGDTAVLFDKPVPATRANLDAAQQFLADRQGGGGTEMMTAIKAALDASDAADHLRIVCFMTDGAVGNDKEIIAEVKKHPNARVFSFGIGSSVNRFLLDSVAREGRGEAEYVLLEDDGTRAAKRFYERIRNPYLTDISIDWAGLPVTGVYPKRIPDLFGAKPIVIYGRYTGAASGKIKLRGKIGGLPFEREVTLDLPAEESKNDVLATLWARTKVDELMSQSWDVQTEAAKPAAVTIEQIAKLGVDYRIMTQYTSFVAVEERVVNQMKNGKRVRVPVYAPAGTAFENDASADGNGDMASARGTGIGRSLRGGASKYSVVNSPASINSVTLSAGGPPPPPRPSPPKTISGGVLNGKAVSLPKPAYPAAASAVRASGAVTVQIVIDEAGGVVSANAVSGHPLLRAAAEQAASNSRFSPTMLAGVAVKVSGVIVYNFLSSTTNPGTSPQITVMPGNLQPSESVTPPPLEPSPAEAAALHRRQRLAETLHFWIFDLVARFEKGDAAPADNDAKFVRDGKAHVEVFLGRFDSAIVEKLKAAGITVESIRSGRSVTGWIDVGKLAGLAEIAEVKLILPRV